MIFAARCLGLGLVLGMSLGGLSPLQAQPSSPAIANPGSPGRSVLTLGSQGPQVTELQSILQLLGFYLGRVDGVFSEATQQGVQRFQQAAGLPTTGQMTLVDWSRLLPNAEGQSSQPAPIQPAPTAAATPQATPQSNPQSTSVPTPVPPDPATVSPLGSSTASPPPNPTAQSFPIPEAASQPPSLPPSTTPNPERSPQPTPEPAPSNPTQAPPSGTSISFPLLRLGSEGTAVERLQQRLGALGFYAGEIDGIFGQETEESVRQFQEQFDLEIDGVVGRSTWEILFNTPN